MAATTATEEETTTEPNTRQRLLQAAVDSFAERGYRTRVQDVVKRAGYTPGALYVHFATLHDLIELAVLTEATRVIELFAEGHFPSRSEVAFVIEAIAIVLRGGGVDEYHRSFARALRGLDPALRQSWIGGLVPSGPFDEAARD